MKFNIATCQFTVNSNARSNGRAIAGQIEEAASKGAHVVQFPEGGLSGYAGAHFEEWNSFDWDELEQETEKIISLARKHKIWVILGTAHRLSGNHLPHNSLYAIDPKGDIVERYDKLFCTTGDLKKYSPGNHFAVFEIKGVRCGMLICHDLRYPELYREYRRKGVDCLFHSFFNARAEGATIHTIIVKPTMQAHAACNHMWISVSNASDYYQGWSSFFVYPDGRIAGSLRRHRRGVLITELDTEKEYRDKCAFRDLAMKGTLHSGEVVRDPRSSRRDSL